MPRHLPCRRLAAAAPPTVCLLAVVGSAHAQPQKPPQFAYGTKEEAAELQKTDKVEWKVAAQGSLILMTGNSQNTTLAAGLNASRKANRNKLSLEASGAYARTGIDLAVDGNGNGFIDPGELSRESQTTSRSWLVKGRYDRYFTTADSLFAAAGIAADEPAGKDLVGNGQVGYSRELVHDAVHLVVAEIGYDFSYEDPVTGDALSIHSLRGFAGYGAKLSKDTGVDASVEGLFNVNELDGPAGQISAFDDARINGKLALTTILFQGISFRAGFEARYDHAPSARPPFATPYAAGFTPLAETLDTRTEASLIVSFL